MKYIYRSTINTLKRLYAPKKAYSVDFSKISAYDGVILLTMAMKTLNYILEINPRLISSNYSDSLNNIKNEINSKYFNEWFSTAFYIQFEEEIDKLLLIYPKDYYNKYKSFVLYLLQAKRFKFGNDNIKDFSIPLKPEYSKISLNEYLDTIINELNKREE